MIENLNLRLAVLEDVINDGQGNLRLRFLIPTRGLIGFRSFLQNATRGDGRMSSTFVGYQIKQGKIKRSNQSFLVASQAGISVAYGLTNAQVRGKTIIDVGKQVYEGMIVGLHTRATDILVNVCKEKKLTNMRSSSSDIVTKLIKPVELSLEESLDIISEEELIEITPQHLRLRKRILSTTERLRYEKNASKSNMPIK